MRKRACGFEQPGKFAIVDADTFGLVHPMVERRHQRVSAAELVGIAQHGEMRGDTFRMGRQHIVPIEQRVGIKTSDAAVKHIKVAVAEEIESGDVVGVDMAERRFQIAQFVRVIGVGRDAGPPPCQRLIVGEGDRPDDDIVGAVFDRAAIAIDEPVDIRIPLARFDKELDPRRPAAEIDGDNGERRRHGGRLTLAAGKDRLSLAGPQGPEPVGFNHLTAQSKRAMPLNRRCVRPPIASNGPTSLQL